MEGFPFLTLITFAPLLGAVIVLCMPKDNVKGIRYLSAVASLIPMILAFVAWGKFDYTFDYMTSKTWPLMEGPYDWIPTFNIQYHVGADGLSMPLIILTGILSFLSIVASFNIEKRVKEYFFFFLLLEVGMLGVFVALDFFLFYVFWEIMLVPMYFLIGIWGGPRKEYAAIKFFLYTLFGSVIMLLAILAMYFQSSPHTFNLLELREQGNLWGGGFQLIIFLALFVGFAIKVPVFPFHTWLPDAHVEAPTAVSVILAGVLLKMGTYGIMRVSFPILPDAAKAFAIPLGVLAVINIVYGALVAMAQTDLKKLVAYSSINHMGYALLGMAAMTTTGYNGAVLQMFNHGIITGSLFLLVGVIYDRAHHRDIDGFGGLGVKVPVYSGLMTVAAMASLGLPGLAGFVSEFMCFLGAFKAAAPDAPFPEPLMRVFAIISVVGILVTAGFFLWMIQRIFLGPLNEKYENLKEINKREIFCVAPLVVIMILLGVYPKIILDMMGPTMQALIDFMK